MKKIDINDYGKYKLGLTEQEIKDYLNDIFIRLTEKQCIKVSKRFRKNVLDSNDLYQAFSKIAGINTMAVIKEGKQDIYLMYRYDVERFANVLFYNKPTYWD